jgi:3-deoxy-D-manno-octulosonic-acid transferase
VLGNLLSEIMFIIYDLIFLIFAIFYLPVFLFKKKLHPGFAMRLGSFSRIPELEGPIWLHAVSVGEAMSIRHLVENLKEKFPQKDFIISTVTPTGNKIAQSIAGKNDVVIYLPLDLSWVVRGVIDRIKPSLFVIAETEIWPNLITCLHKRNIPIAVVNARISDRSFKKYLFARFLVKLILDKISVFCVQTPLDARRLEKLGVAEKKIKLTGNMKFDIKIRDYGDLKKDYADYRVKLGIGVKEKLIVAASTHPGEEVEILKVYLDLLKSFPDLKLLIVPRHPERSESLVKLINNYPLLEARRISQLSRLDASEETSANKQVFILDTIGQLMYFYAIADIVFVGGSLVKSGGHNILEPASLGKPILFGKYMFNFRDITGIFLKNNAGIMVNDAKELEIELRKLLEDKLKILELSDASRRAILENQGATARNSEAITALLKT